MHSPSPGDRTADRGSVTAEFATVVPAVAVMLALVMSALQLAGTQVRLQDAAADSARIVARGEDVAAAARHAGALLPSATVSVQHRGGLVCARVAAPGARGGPFAAMSLSAEACALDGGL